MREEALYTTQRVRRRLPESADGRIVHDVRKVVEERGAKAVIGGILSEAESGC